MNSILTVRLIPERICFIPYRICLIPERIEKHRKFEISIRLTFIRGLQKGALSVELLKTINFAAVLMKKDPFLGLFQQYLTNCRDFVRWCASGGLRLMHRQLKLQFFAWLARLKGLTEIEPLSLAVYQELRLE
jgi:hypothetical protein